MGFQKGNCALCGAYQHTTENCFLQQEGACARIADEDDQETCLPFMPAQMSNENKYAATGLDRPLDRTPFCFINDRQGNTSPEGPTEYQNVWIPNPGQDTRGRWVRQFAPNNLPRALPNQCWEGNDNYGQFNLPFQGNTQPAMPLTEEMEQELRGHVLVNTRSSISKLAEAGKTPTTVTRGRSLEHSGGTTTPTPFWERWLHSSQRVLRSQL